MTTVRILAAAALAALLLPLGPASAQGSRTISTRLSPPERAAGFRLTSIRQMEGAAGGHMRYRHAEGLELDAYLYPLPDQPDCFQACDSVAVQAEADSFRATLDSLAVERDDPVRVEEPGAAAHGRHLWLRGPGGRSHLLLYGAGSYLIRVRAAFPPSARSDSLTAHFAREFVRAVLRRTGADACETGPPDPEVIRLSVESRTRIAALRDSVGAVLAGLGFALAPGAGARDAWQTEPVAGWPAGIDYGPWARERSPGFLVGVSLEERPASTRITVSAQALCAPAPGTEDPKTQELALELRTASEVLARLDPGRARN